MTTTQEIDTSKSDLTPLMRQYSEIKARNPEAILLYRMGDFYEMFNDDAKVASKVLGLTLTSRNHGGTENTPLAGFPFHALDRYAHRLVKAGYRIAVCEQTEDPKAAKGIVKRDIIEVITAGTATEGSIIEEKANNFIVGACRNEGRIGIAVCDLSTGQFEVEELAEEEAGHELVRINPSEIVAAQGGEEFFRKITLDQFLKTMISPYDAWKFSYDTAAAALKDHFQVASLDGWGLESYPRSVCAAGGLLLYLKEQKKNNLRHISAITRRDRSPNMRSSIPRPSATSSSSGPSRPTRRTARSCPCLTKQVPPWAAACSNGSSRGRSRRSPRYRSASRPWNGLKKTRSRAARSSSCSSASRISNAS